MNFKSEDNLYFDDDGNPKLMSFDHQCLLGQIQDYRVKSVKTSPNGVMAIDVSVTLWPVVKNVDIDFEALTYDRI